MVSTYACGHEQRLVVFRLLPVVRSCSNLITQEVEVLGLAGATLLSKYRKIATFDELLERLFFLGKATVAVLLFFVGVLHVISYIIIWAGALLACVTI